MRCLNAVVVCNQVMQEEKSNMYYEVETTKRVFISLYDPYPGTYFRSSSRHWLIPIIAQLATSRRYFAHSERGFDVNHRRWNMITSDSTDRPSVEHLCHTF